MKKKFIIGAVLGAVMLSGCATIVGDRDETITLKSQPADADIVITDERGETIFSGTTPTTTQLKKSDGSYFGGKTYTVEISKAGYEARTLTIDSTANGWYIGGNLLFGGLIGWLVVDPMTGAMYNLSPNEINAELHQELATSTADEGALNIVLLEDVPSRLRDELVLIGQA
ncbi:MULTISPECIES: hypothetical protein [Modicisalibacter]|uniref:hypothetical protein n=1 Tax=Modicisalibacter TaxID=574347 RepID=UPI00100B0E7D|nr:MULTISPECIES: hypothetical protein [Halomonadaceae]MBZ9557903.1 hypothetical protein [Modicisalibacter sp. R2A 31.J]MBZ9573430.1 hypothetical protein [Modicisalibacter sp. MOD 31.J]